VRVLDACLRLLHPFTPFVTEELWQHLKEIAQEASAGFTPYFAEEGWPKALMIARWPEAQPLEGWEDRRIAEFGLVQDTVRAIRNLRTEKRVPPSRRIPATLVAGDRLELIREQAPTIAYLANLDREQFTLAAAVSEKPQDQVAIVVAGMEIYLPLAELVDPEEELARLQKEHAEISEQIERLEKLLSGAFAERAPAPVVEKERQKLATFKESAARLQDQMAGLKA
ncbi:MAG TPA: class I tRNA ligase family protein, partial [Anaerolineaceae bacterium]|nr:class I tRNA ligase family protein [Anaerolineaceae bacterium]